MACPYFQPAERLATTPRGTLAKPPLGALHAGHCAASSSPCPGALVETACNFGYAPSCPALPPDRTSDAHRFVIARADGPLVLIRWSIERAHRPVAAGELHYDTCAQRWVTPPPPQLAPQLKVYLENYRTALEETIAR